MSNEHVGRETAPASILLAHRSKIDLTGVEPLAEQVERTPEFRTHEDRKVEVERLKAAVDTADLIARTTGAKFVRKGEHADAACPWCQKPGAKDRKLRAWNDGPRQGAWKCAKCDRGGDALNLIMEWHGLDFGGALDELRRLAGSDYQPSRKRPAKAPAEPVEAEDTGAGARARALALWAQASPTLPPEAVSYFTQVRGLPEAPGGLRWHPQAIGKVGAILAPVTSGAGEITGVHRIRVENILSPDQKRRLALGPQGDGAIRVYPFNPHEHENTLGLVEGVEDAVAAKALLGVPFWSVISGGRFPKVTLPGGVARVLIVADRDTPTKEAPEGIGIKAAREAAVKLVRRGVETVIYVAASDAAKDANDALRGGIGLRVLAHLRPERPLIVLPTFAKPNHTAASAQAGIRDVIGRALDYGAECAQRRARDLEAYENRQEGDPAIIVPEGPRWLLRVTAGTGKTRVMVDKLAEAEAGDFLVVVPDHKLGAQIRDDIRAAIVERVNGTKGLNLNNIGLATVHLLGRNQPNPSDKHGHKMCQRDPKLLEAVERSGANVTTVLCGVKEAPKCELFARCAYIRQLNYLNEVKGKRIVIATHEHGFNHLPKGFKPTVVFVDEGVGTMHGVRLIELETLTRAVEGYGSQNEELVEKVLAAVERSGQELAELRALGVEPAHLVALANRLRARHQAYVEAVENAVFEAEIVAAANKAQEMRFLRSAAGFLDGLAGELGQPRDGTNANRLETRRVETTVDGDTLERKDVRLLVNRSLRRFRFPRDTAIVWMDATADRLLCEAFLGRSVEYHAFEVPLRGTVVQVGDQTNSKFSMLRDASAKGNRERMTNLITDLHTLSDKKLLVVGPKELIRGAKDGSFHGFEAELTDRGVSMEWMHYRAERGLNAGEACSTVLVIGREEPAPWAVENIARAFAADRPEPFQAVEPDDKGGPTYHPAIRPRLMRDGSSTWARLTTHPDPLGRAVLEQIREAGIVQAVGRARAVHMADKLIVVATSVPVPVEVDFLADQTVLDKAASLAPKAARAAERTRLFLFDWQAEGFTKVEHARGVTPTLAALLGADRKLAPNPIRSLYGFGASFSTYPAKLRGQGRGPRRDVWVVSRLPAREAFVAVAAAGHDVEPVEPLPPETVVKCGTAAPMMVEPRMAARGEEAAFTLPAWALLRSERRSAWAG